MDWLERDKHIIGGLDHLGVEVVSAGLYSLMLPGISNLTERARYFSVYPWVLHEYAQRSGGRQGRKEWRTWIRSMEFAYALACAAHEKTDDADDVGGVVGAVRARALLKGLDSADRVTLEPYVAINDKGLPKRGGYFSNPEGGYADR
jgi:hypothetical protein